MRQAATSKPEVISAIRSAKRRLKRTPTRSEFQRLSGIHWTRVQRLFGGYRVAVREAGLEPDPGGIRIDTTAMLLDFARVAREVGRHPTRDEYCELGKYSSASLETRFQRWSAMRTKFLEFAQAGGLEREWKDVVEKLKNGPVPRRGGGKNWINPKPWKRRGTEEAEEGLPRIHADDRGSRTERSLAQMNADERGSRTERNLPQMKADERRLESGNSDQELHVEQMRPEILMPELRGMRCVTRTILWALCAERSTHLVEPGVTEREGNAADSNLQNRWDGQTNADRREQRDGLDLRRPGRTEAGARTGCWTSANGNVGWPAHHGVTETRRSYAGAVTGKGHLAADEDIAAGENNARFWNSSFPKRVLRGRPLLGAPLMRHGLMYEPVNEMGVVFLFGMMAERLGFWVESLQAGFPDCEAKLEVEPGRWQHVRIEFEYESRKFRDHKHDPAKCDMIVCWRHNWKGCPGEIQVVELGEILRSGDRVIW